MAMTPHAGLIAVAAGAMVIGGLSARASAQAQPSETVARTACSAPLMALTDALVGERKPRPEAVEYVDALVASFANKGPDRENILSTVSTEAQGLGRTRHRAELEASACVAIVGAAFDAGMTNAAELRSYWEVRRQAVIPPPPPAETGAMHSQCVSLDQGKSAHGEPALLRNRCDYLLTVSYCLIQAPPNSPSDEVSCEKDRGATYDIRPHHAAMIVLTGGTRFQWAACQPPFKPRTWWRSSDSTPMGICEK